MSRYERYLDEFGAELATAARKRVRRARRRVAALVTAAAAVVVAVLVGLGTPPAGPGDVVGRALAAVTVPNGIIHYRVLESSGPARADGLEVRFEASACLGAEPISVWQATNPVRWRMAFPPNPGRDGCRSSGRAAEFAYAGRTRTTYFPATRRLQEISGVRVNAAEMPFALGEMLRSPADPVAEHDPVAAIRSALVHGTLRDAGERTVGGRRVRTFTGTWSAGGSVPQAVTYDVDPDSFVPVRITVSFRGARAGNEPGAPGVVTELGYASRLEFVHYEGLPDTPANRALLKIDPAPGTEIRRETPREVNQRAKRRAAELRREAARRAARAAKG